ncbi:hypothetical protein [Actinoplanes sp. HUAS TT8]|uniref:hypothetical protein n=1 Tax=Actinoplanes sp. HUAS TT8 TaxID=3447453 RepID=UPI003F51D4E7
MSLAPLGGLSLSRFAGPRFDAGPVFGMPAGVRFDGVERWLWWGQDVTGEDCVATLGGRPVIFATGAECQAAFPTLTLASGKRDDDFDPVPVDLGPAQIWVRGERLAVPVESVLNLWNLAIDVAYSTGRPFPQRSRRHDRCYDKLMAHHSPYLFGVDEYHPIWSPSELTLLRQTLARATHVLRSALS